MSLGAVDSSGSDGNTENGLSTEQETGRINEIIDEFKRRYPTEGEYLKRYLKAGKIELAEVWFYNIHYKGAYDGTTRTDGSDVIYIDPDTDIGLAADLLLQYLHVMQHYGNSKFSTEMNPNGNMGAIHPKHRVHQSTLSPITAFRVGTWVLAVTWLTETSSVCQRRFVRFTRYKCRFRL